VAQDSIGEGLHQQVAQLQRELRAVHTIAAQLGRETEIDEIVRHALEIAMATVEARAGSILLYDALQEKLVFRYVVGGGGDALLGVALDPAKGIAGRVFREGVTSVADQVGLDSDHTAEIEERTNFLATNMVTVPLKQSQDAPLGVMQVLNKSEGSFDHNDVAVLEILADQIASRLENASLQQKARLAAVAEHVGGICHDLKNMMTPVQTGAQMLRDFLGSDAEQIAASLETAGLGEECRAALEAVLTDLQGYVPEIIDGIHESALITQQHMSEIANAVKSLSTEPSFEDGDVVEVAERAVRVLNTQADGLGVEMSLDQVGDIPRACVDSRLLYNALYNLTFNALEACEGQGSVTVRLSALDDFLVIEVVDTGKGMPEEVRAKAFTPQAVTTKDGGTGLGTKIVRNVVDAHRGNIVVESEIGRGTTIRLEIPLRHDC
jgi:signal transduction histidine kinase